MRLAVITVATALLFAMPASSAKTVIQPFAGTWIDCDSYQGDDACSYKLLAQKGARLCGLWSYWASGREYQGRVTATASGRIAKIDQICGRPGSDTSTECTRDKGAQETWEPSSRTMFLCKGALYESRADRPMSCDGIDKDLGLQKARGNIQSKMMFEPTDKAWLKTCVEAAAD